MLQTKQPRGIVVGGSSGIGLAIVRELINKGYYVYVVSRHRPDEALLPLQGTWEFLRSDLRDYDEQLFERFSMDAGIDVLMITAGFGRVAEFDELSQSEIEQIFAVNAIAPIRIIRQFYKRIKGAAPFYCGVMGSIAGLVSSPLFSAYSASKAAVCRFVESVNIELEENGTANRILNVSPGSIKGTQFNGGPNDLTLTKKLAEEITERLFESETLYIPEYDEIYGNVIARYRANAHDFGVQSYEYKLRSGRIREKPKEIIGYLSGTFDLFHIGHLNLLRRAKEQCERLIVGVHPSGIWKGKETFIPLEERMAILASCKYVNKVVIAPDEDNDAWKEYHYHRLFVGSDYQGTKRFQRYEDYFKDKDVKIIYFPYTQGTSSTQLRSILKEQQL